MKKNIEKPYLDDMALRVLKAHFQMIWHVGIDANKKTIPRKYRRKMRDFIGELAAMIEMGEWEEALTIAFKNQSFGENLESAIKTLLNATEEEFEERGHGNCYEDIKLGTMRVAKVYEYMTGKDPMTGKKLHKGALDA